MLYPLTEIQTTPRAIDVAILRPHNANRTHCVSGCGYWTPSTGRLRAVPATVASDRPTTQTYLLYGNKTVSHIEDTDPAEPYIQYPDMKHTEDT